ncbi:hypothetical protein KIN20_023424 [Parelaphostrongylus tenuis]|uniref:Uncharacterized protein n=1 Tax=Parelaphostrongylus tenuis TaxID=148309 RepID=A0AAD5QW24_PARTN|nr:hypothetical protein KIN20_023424 [Parelaphostrongylus tenuis]
MAALICCIFGPEKIEPLYFREDLKRLQSEVQCVERSAPTTRRVNRQTMTSQDCTAYVTATPGSKEREREIAGGELRMAMNERGAVLGDRAGPERGVQSTGICRRCPGRQQDTHRGSRPLGKGKDREEAGRPSSMPRRRGGFGLSSLRRELHLHNLFRDSPRGDNSASQSDTGIPVSATFSAHLAPSVAPQTTVHARRESFLYRSSEDTRDNRSTAR